MIIEDVRRSAGLRTEPKTKGLEGPSSSSISLSIKEETYNIGATESVTKGVTKSMTKAQSLQEYL